MLEIILCIVCFAVATYLSASLLWDLKNKINIADRNSDKLKQDNINLHKRLTEHQKFHEENFNDLYKRTYNNEKEIEKLKNECSKKI